jgi:hypothetical protein
MWRNLNSERHFRFLGGVVPSAAALPAVLDPREIPRPAGESAGLRNGALHSEKSKLSQYAWIGCMYFPTIWMYNASDLIPRKPLRSQSQLSRAFRKEYL